MSDQQHNIAQLNSEIVNNSELERGNTAEAVKEDLELTLTDLEENYGQLRPLIRDELLNVLQSPVFLGGLLRNLLVAGVRAIDYQNKQESDLSRPTISYTWLENSLAVLLDVKDGLRTATVYNTNKVDSEAGWELGEQLAVDERSKILETLALSANLEEGVNKVFITTWRNAQALEGRAGAVVDELVAEQHKQ